MKPAHFRRENFPNIAPAFFIDNAPKFIDFLVAAFNGIEAVRVPRADQSIMYAEVAVGNSVIEVADANQEYPQRFMATHLYVPNADATYAKAVAAGATPVYPPSDDHPSGDRWGEAKDPFGNTWYIATRRGQAPGPERFLTVQPYLHLSDAHKAIPFIEAAFGAQATGVNKSPDGKVLHATIEIYGATLEVDEAEGDVQPTPSYLHVYVPDTDALYLQAVAAGATSVKEPITAPYGDRAATISDPFGNTWYIATRKGQVPGPEGFLSIQPYLHLRDAHNMIPFIEAAFGGHATGLHKSSGGKVLHATIEIYGATLEIDEAQGDLQPTPSYLHLYVPDTDALYAEAIAAGAKGVKAPYTAPYRDRAATITDPFGNTWFLATYIGEEA